jgi:hypothetical protein
MTHPWPQDYFLALRSVEDGFCAAPGGRVKALIWLTTRAGQYFYFRLYRFPQDDPHAEPQHILQKPARFMFFPLQKNFPDL